MPIPSLSSRLRQIEMSGQFHMQVTVPAGKEPLLLVGWRLGRPIADLDFSEKKKISPLLGFLGCPPCCLSLF